MLGDHRLQVVNVLSQYAHHGSRNSTTANAFNRINLATSSHHVHRSPGLLPQSWPPVSISYLASSSFSVLSSSLCSSLSPSLTCRLSTLCAAVSPLSTMPFHTYCRIPE